MLVEIAPIVGGHGDVQAIPVLLRRVVRSLNPVASIVIRQPYRCAESKLKDDGELSRYIEGAGLNLGGNGTVMVFADCDTCFECPAVDGPSLLSRCEALRPDVRFSVVLAKMEFEAWFLAAAESLRGFRGLNPNCARPLDPEGIRDAKGWLTKQMRAGMSYRETVDQSAMADKMDIYEALSNSSSFRKLYREVEKIVQRQRADSTPT